MSDNENFSDDEYIETDFIDDTDHNSDTEKNKTKFTNDSDNEDSDGSNSDIDSDESDSEDNYIELPNTNTNDNNVFKEYIVHNNNKLTSNYLFRYEYSKIIGIRAEQISQGSKVFIDTQGLSDPIEMAKKELFSNKCPLSVKRCIGNNQFEIWSVNELIKKKYE